MLQGSPRPTEMTMTWDAHCSDLAYPHELRVAGARLLQDLQSSQDKLGEGKEVPPEAALNALLRPPAAPPRVTLGGG